jgi:hypothetical protein
VCQGFAVATGGVLWFSTAPAVKAEDCGKPSLGLLRTETGSIAENPGAPIPLGPSHLFETGEISIDSAIQGLDAVSRRRPGLECMSNPVATL